MKIPLKGVSERYKRAGASREDIKKILRAWRSHDFELLREGEYDGLIRLKIYSYNKNFPGCGCFILKCKLCSAQLVSFTDFSLLPLPSLESIKNSVENVLTCEERVIKEII